PNQSAAPTQTQNGTAIQPSQEQKSAQETPPTPFFFDWGATGTRIGLGILLFIAGMMGIALGRERGRRAKP
ncbi:MAG: hypothetical protein H0U76_24760, partial [Ktedonobacteraceae bacterium]|nr:hypothetical protein [Ktedonobacteraceae bacterium]